MTHKNKTILAIIIGVILLGSAVLIWAQKTGKISIFGSENLQRITVQIKNLVDWNKGEFANTQIQDGILKLTTTSNPTTNPPSVTTKTINDVATEMVFKNSPKGNCNALAPSDWAIVSDDYGLEAGLVSPDITTFASWSVPWALNSLLQTIGHPELAQEENFLKAALCTTNFADRAGVGSLEYCGNGGDYKNITLGAAVSKPGGYYLRDYQLTNNAMQKNLKGQLIYKNFSSGDVILYLMRMGATTSDKWEQNGALAVSSAISIRCRVNSAGSATGPSGVSRQADDSEITLSDKWQEATMGYENVYNPATGQHWEAPTSSYWDTGPQGAGYYYQNGNDLTKLTRGFGY